ncbi:MULTISPECIES: hypothetical protein [Loigolactobacillus]|uniref:Uncharacterized protein n=1 Tax=Loigolactobacillus backii TaxID=375175 RepID=A0A192H141_9LACO|nr:MULTISPECIES: hypothetical protein [Loigolactobacillus]ANK62075.1 hypothetical protein AYR53_04405 [Loigolactobacillus backii]ANK68731.1 hypothetical protein AYR56_00320 [Loigolactobacillus backii]MDA5386735.1 hypothetical protein [Loigolactobacillus backii]MDA5389260.1 hypothetical protein [Loigolactobacillus backii]
MAHNVSRTEELTGILNDVKRHRFRSARSINPASMLYQTAQDAVAEKFLRNAIIEDGTDKPVASVDLHNAELTETGETFLAEHLPQKD